MESTNKGQKSLPSRYVLDGVLIKRSPKFSIHPPSINSLSCATPPLPKITPCPCVRRTKSRERLPVYLPQKKERESPPLPQTPKQCGSSIAKIHLLTAYSVKSQYLRFHNFSKCVWRVIIYGGAHACRWVLNKLLHATSCHPSHPQKRPWCPRN